MSIQSKAYKAFKKRGGAGSIVGGKHVEWNSRIVIGRQITKLTKQLGDLLKVADDFGVAGFVREHAIIAGTSARSDADDVDMWAVAQEMLPGHTYDLESLKDTLVDMQVELLVLAKEIDRCSNEPFELLAMARQKVEYDALRMRQKAKDDASGVRQDG